MILTLGPVSGAHLKPVITLADLLFKGLTPRAAAAYLVSQLAGGVTGVILANLMFPLKAVQLSRHVRTGGGLWLAELVATFGLVLVVFALVRWGRVFMAPFAVGVYIAGAYFFTSSTSFANPAVTVARTLSDTFSGIAPGSAPAFVMAQLGGGLLGALAVRFLYPDISRVGPDVVVPHPDGNQGSSEEGRREVVPDAPG